MIIDGGGMLARAFMAGATDGNAIGALVFARGVARSDEVRPNEFERERRALDAALAQANRLAIPIVYFTGAPVFGPFRGPVSEATDLRPVTSYGRHQAEVEDQIRSRANRHLILRLPNVVGSQGNRHQLIPSLIHQIQQGDVAIQQDAARDLLDVEDLVALTLDLLRLGYDRETFVVASGLCTPVPAIVDELSRLLGMDPRRRSLSGGEAQRFDTSRLREALPQRSFPRDYWRVVLRNRAPQLATWLEST